MNTNQESISPRIDLETAAKACRISTGTVERFIEAGYFSDIQPGDGTPLLKVEELESLFGVDLSDIKRKVISRPKAAIEENEPEEHEEQEAIHTEESELLEKEEESNEVSTPFDVEFQSRSSRTPSSAIEFLEKMLAEKESTIRELKEERNWLRDRVQKLEEKSDRDQILLMSETQTLRRFMELQSPQKSFWSQTLKFLGFSPSENQEEKEKRN